MKLSLKSDIWQSKLFGGNYAANFLNYILHTAVIDDYMSSCILCAHKNLSNIVENSLKYVPSNSKVK